MTNVQFITACFYAWRVINYMLFVRGKEGIIGLILC